MFSLNFLVTFLVCCIFAKCELHADIKMEFHTIFLQGLVRILICRLICRMNFYMNLNQI